MVASCRLGGVQWGVATDESTVYVAVSDLKVDPVAFHCTFPVDASNATTLPRKVQHE
jgi:hypothetical protein